MIWTGSKFREWIKAQELSLHQQAKLAGLLEHSTTIGTAREFLVKRVLQSVLPPIVHVGSGIILDAHDNVSKQIDVVLYDSRFPVMEFERGVGLYPIEGVIATIEVKTNLSSSELKTALDNCHSVLAIKPGSPNVNAIRDRANGLRVELKTSHDEALLHAGCELLPATYIFAYSGLNSKTLCDSTVEWFAEKTNQQMLTIGPDEEHGPAGLCPGLPRVIVSGGSVGIVHDGWFKIVPGPDDEAGIKKECGENDRAMMMFWESEFPYWWLASHVLHTACARLGMSHAASGLRYKFDHYIEEPMETIKNCHYLTGTIREK